MWGDMDLARLVKLVLRLLYGSCSVLLVGMDLELKCVIEIDLANM